MSFISRQRVRQRMNSRMAPSSVSPVSSNSLSLVIPSIEESLQNWTKRDSTCSTLAWLLDSCRCCNKTHCENLNIFVQTIKKLEDDSRLAAEIGQSLLQKHEQYVTETSEARLGLEEQLLDTQGRVLELEQLLIQSDTIKLDLEQEKNRMTWEWQKTQKVCEKSQINLVMKALDETLTDMETCNQRSNKLFNELSIRTREVEKLQACKSMASQGEDELRSALEDAEQELADSRKAELSLESKYKKLKTKYDLVYYEKIKLEQERKDLESEKTKSKLFGIKEANDTLRKDINKHISSALLFRDSKGLPPVIESNDHLVELIKDIVSTNNELKVNLQETKDLLSESRNESMNLLAKMEQEDKDKVVYDDDDTMTELDIWPQESTSNTTCSSTDPSAVVHHHYHYHVRNKRRSSSLPKEPEMSPCRQLYHQACLLQERLQQTETRTINRKLHRVFDIFDLSSMSNSNIESILMTEVGNLSKRIPSTEEELSLLIQVVQDLLKEICQLRININDLQVEYVKKVEENGARLEKEIRKKHERLRKSTALSWFSNIFRKSASPQRSQEQKRNFRRHSRSLPSVPSAATAIYVHTGCPTAILIPSKQNSALADDHQCKYTRCSGPSSSYPTKSPSSKKRLTIGYPIRPSQSTNSVSKSCSLKKKRSSLTISSFDATGWLGNKINQ
ncbi:hypothetical protein BY458DRAFT_493915 [Sporodiniella umbellata]|nr:hypothetical protein BY458DRAFT_493915 [Sporodiniella umbellata]